jgi:hypothetical protein
LFGLALLVLTVAAAITHWAWRVDVILPDEVLGVLGSRAVINDPFGALQNPAIFQRGLERLTSIVLVLPNVVFSGTTAELKAAHVLIALLAAGVALPVYAIGRELSLSGWWSLLAAALAVVGPWLLYAETFLNGTVATLTVTIFILVVLRGTLRPSVVNDLLIFVVAVLMTLARPNQIAFFALVPVVFALHALRQGEPPLALAARARALPGRLWREHRTFVVAAVIAVLLGLVVGLNVLVGSYSNSLPWEHLNLGQLWGHFGLSVASLALATGFVPAVLATPWLIGSALRPRSPAAGVFAQIALLAIFFYVVTTYYAVPEERYVAVLGCIFPLAFAAALSSRRIGVVATALSAVLIGLLAFKFGFHVQQKPYDIFVAPARILISQDFARQLAAISPIDSFQFALPLVMLSLVAILIALGLQRLRDRAASARRLAGGVALLVLLAGTISAGWAMREFTAVVDLPNVSSASALWVDDAAGSESVGLIQTGSDYELYPTQNLLVRNKSLDTVITVGTRRVPGPCCSTFLKRIVPAVIDKETGLLKAKSKTPRLVAVPSSVPFGIAGGLVATSTNYAGSAPHRLVRAERPLRLQWLADGLSDDLGLHPDRVARLHVYPLGRGNGNICLSTRATVYPSDLVLESSPAPVGGPGRQRLAAGPAVTLAWRLPSSGGRRTITLTQEPVSANAPDTAIYLEGTTVERCR